MIQTNCFSGTVACGRKSLFCIELYGMDISVPRELLDENALCLAAKMLYIAIIADNRGQHAVSFQELARMTGIRDRRTIVRCLKALQETGWMQVSPTGSRPGTGSTNDPHGGFDGTGPNRDDWRRLRKIVLTPRNPVMELRIRKAEEFNSRLRTAPHVGEFLMKGWLDLLVDDTDYVDNFRPDFLRNPVTGENLEYDRYYRRGVAFEFNGPQHYGPTRRYPDRDRARDLRVRDLIKKALSLENGVELLIIRPGDLSMSRLTAKIGNRLPLRLVDFSDPLRTALDKASSVYTRRVSRSVAQE